MADPLDEILAGADPLDSILSDAPTDLHNANPSRAPKITDSYEKNPLDMTFSEKLRSRYDKAMADPIGDLKKARSDAAGIPSDILSGFYTEAAKAASLPFDAALDAAKIVGFKGLPEPGRARETFMKAMVDAGFSNYMGPAQTWSQRIGEEGMRQFLFYAGMRGAAPTMAKATPGGLVERMGTEILAKPGTTAAASIASAPGVVAGEAVGEPVGGKLGETAGSFADRILGTESGAEVGKKVGEVTGKMVGGMVGGVASATPVLGAKRGFDTRRNAGGELGGPVYGDTAILPREGDAMKATEFAQHSTKRALDTIDRRVANIIDDAGSSVVGNLDPESAWSILNARLKAYYTKVLKPYENSLYEKAWAGGKHTHTIDPSDIVTAIKDDIAQSASSDRVIPHKQYQDFLNDALRDVKGMKGLKEIVPMSLKKLQEHRTAIREATTEAGASTVTGKEVQSGARNRLREIQDLLIKKLDEGLLEAGGNPQDIGFARSVSKRLGDLWKRGPVGELMAKDAQGQPRVAPGDTGKSLMGDPRGLPALREATEPLPGQPVQGVFGAKRAELAVGSDVSDALRAHFRQMVDEPAQIAGQTGEDMAKAATKGAASFQKKILDRADAYADVTGRLTTAVKRISWLWKDKQSWQASALAEYGVKDPQAAVRNVMNSSNPSAKAADLIRSFARDPDAMDGFRRAVAEEFFLNAKGQSAEVIARHMSNPKNQRLMTTVFGPDGAERITRIVNSAKAWEAGEQSSPLRLARKATSWMGHVLGNRAGHLFAGVVGGGSYSSLTYPARFSKGMRDMIAKAMRDQDPTQLLVEAAVNPQMERFLNNKVPENMTEAFKAMKVLKRLGAGVNTGYTMASDRYERERMNTKKKSAISGSQ